MPRVVERFARAARGRSRDFDVRVARANVEGAVAEIETAGELSRFENYCM